MNWRRYPRLWFTLALTLILAASAALWMYDRYAVGHRRPASIETEQEATPSVTPTADSDAGFDVSPPPPAWRSGGAALVWVAVGIVLVTGLAFVAFRWYRPHS